VRSFALGKRTCPEDVPYFAGVVAGVAAGAAPEAEVAGAAAPDDGVAAPAAAGSLGLVVVVVVDDDGSAAGFSPPQAIRPIAIAAKIAAFFMEISSSMYFSNERGLYFAHQDTPVN